MFLTHTLWLFNIAIENGPFIDGLPIKNACFFPWQTVSHNQMVGLFMCFPEGAPTPYGFLLKIGYPSPSTGWSSYSPFKKNIHPLAEKSPFLWTNSSLSSWVGIFWIQLSLPGIRYMYVSIYIHSYLYIYIYVPKYPNNIKEHIQYVS